MKSPRRSRLPHWIRLLAMTPMLGALLLLGALGVAAEGDMAPDYRADLLGGTGDLGLSDLRGSVVLLNTWATWCHPCREEMPYLESLQTQYGDSGLRVIGVSVDRGGSDDRVRQFATDIGVTFTILRDEDNDFSRTFRTLGVPETLLIDRDGEILYRWRGQLDEDNVADRALIEDALVERGDRRLRRRRRRSRGWRSRLPSRPACSVFSRRASSRLSPPTRPS